MRVSTITAAICGLFLCLYVIPVWGQDMIAANPECEGWYWPWLIFAWAFSLPCFAILVYIWKVAGAVIHETVLTMKTAKWVKTGGFLLMADAAFVFVGNVVLLLLNMNHPGVLLMCVIGDISAFALGVLAAVLSRYLTKAAVLQEESEGTL
jgi:hypothetical protein